MDLMQLFLSLAAIAVGVLVIMPLFSHVRQGRRKSRYTRSPPYRVWFNQQEFKVHGLTSFAEVDVLIDYLTHTYDLETVEHDPEPDESFWVFASDIGAVKLFYDDHEGARIRTMRKSQRGLFHWLLRDLPVRRVVLRL